MRESRGSVETTSKARKDLNQENSSASGSITVERRLTGRMSYRFKSAVRNDRDWVISQLQRCGLHKLFISKTIDESEHRLASS